MYQREPIRPSVGPYEEYPLQELLRRTAARMPEKVAVIDGDRRFTYRQLDDHSDRLAGALAARGIFKGDRVAILSPNCAEFVIAFYGVIKAGAVVTTINTGYREQEIAHQLDDSGAVALVAHESMGELAKAAVKDCHRVRRLVTIADSDEGPDSFWGLINRGRGSPPPLSVDPKEDLVALPYSSGTTGLSKGVMLTHHNLTSNVQQFLSRTGEEAGFREDDVLLVHLPLFHIYGMNVLMNGAIGAGATQVMMGRFDMELFLGLLSEHRITMLFTVPPVGLGLTQYPGVKEHDHSALRCAFFGAAPLSADLQGRIGEALGAPVMQGYGLTETSPVTNCDFLEPHRTRPGSVGPAVPDTELKVLDLEDGTTEVAPGELGELLVRGPQVLKGYFNNPQATAETLSGDGWLRTGDIVRMDQDGYVWIVDRQKELIKYKGFQVPPAELEALLLEHPAVADAAVVAKPDAEAGEVPKAFVVKKPDAAVSEQELMSYVADSVATFKQVRDVEFVDAIPKNPSGKILRRVLVEQERARAAG